MTIRHCQPTPAPRQQRGIVLFVALIAMVILSLAGIALVRSVDTGTQVAGNLAFRQASIAPVNLAIEQAVQDIFKVPVIASLLANDPPNRYYASLQPGEKANGVPAVLSGAHPPPTYPGAFPVNVDAVTGIEVRAVIERICRNAGPVRPPDDNCDTVPPKVSQAGTDNEPGIPVPPIPHYRVTVRTDLPGTNAVSFAQAFLR